MELETAKQAVVAVGNKDGRGFAINTDPRLIVTAAHCLPQLPLPQAAAAPQERTYENFVGRIGEDRQEIWAECLFADPVADIAVLSEPDGQVFFGKNDAFETFMDQIPALECGRLPPPPPLMEEPHQEQAWLLGIGGEWESCRVGAYRFGRLWIMNALKGIVGGMSGSPIMNTSSEAIGVVSVSGGTGDSLHTKGGPQASLQYNLPGWVFLLAQNRAD